MWGAVGGFLMPFVPDGLKMLKGWLDHRQEMQMMKLRFDHASAEHEWKMQEIQIQTDQIDIRSARKQRESYGVQLLNAAAQAENQIVRGWAFNLVFLVFSIADFMAALTRPLTTAVIMTLWAAYKLAVIYAIYENVGASGLGAAAATLTAEGAWTDFDEDLFAVVIGFWFGWRTRKAVTK